ncbi:hemolysin D [Rhizobiales bacterium GAS188]|nr:hemolysin D [Rhizobiales bacterium GAS188]
MRRFTVCRAGSMRSADNIVALPRARNRRDREELAFLPAALEIMETPPSPLGRWITVTIAGVFCLALAWASLGRIDIVASAPGKIIPSDRTKVVQPFETGVVRAIRIRDGQAVKAGDVLIELDPTMNEAERDHLRSDLISARLDAARLRAALSDGSDPLAHFHPPDEASPALISMQRQFLIDQTSEHHAKLASLDRQKAQKEAERATIAATVGKFEQTIPVLQQRVDIRKTLFDHSTGSKANYLEMLQALVDQQQDVIIQKSRAREADAALAAITETRAQAGSEYRRTLSGELVEAERKIAGLSQDLVKAEQRTKFQQLIAPVDGVVQQLAVHTVGGIVTPAQALLVVVPRDSHLEIEAMVSNRDIGFVHAGQDAEIKIDTFNFTRYGLLHGQVLSVSQDAITRDTPQDKDNGRAQNAESSTSEPKGQELAYAARVSLDRTQMQVENNSVNMSPGMAVTVEIKTGSRRVISYLLSPLLRYKQETLRER